MAELKAYKIVLSTESETVGGVVYSKKVYDQADVDKYIADLQSEIERLKKSQESSSKIFDHVNEERIECQKQNFIIKRALWLARAELCRRLDVDRYLRKHRNSWYNENYLTWNEACVAMEVKMCKAESKCRAMAEKFR